MVFAPLIRDANLASAIEDYEPAYRLYLDGGPVDDRNLDDIVSWIERHRDLNDPALRVLDVGAGSGKLLRRLRDTRACVATGLEPASALFDAYRLAELGVLPMTLPELARQSPAAFDIVTVVDVIEHVPAAGEFVEALGRITRPGGLVFVSTPDLGGPLARLMGRRWHHFNAYHHCLYRPATLATAAALGGFEVVEAGHVSKHMPVNYLWHYALNFGLGSRTPAAPARGGWALTLNLHDIVSTVWRRT